MPTKPKSNFNACEDFSTTIVSGHVLAATMKVLKMTALDNLPSKESLKVVDKFVDSTLHKEKIHTCKTVSPSDLDLVYSYATEVFSLGLFFQEYSDAIREGDGTGVL